MVEQPQSGELFGIPYNFERPSIGRMVSAYWRPGEGMLVEKPFGVGYTLNLASWRTWIVLLVAAGMLYQERRGSVGAAGGDERDEQDEPVEVVVDD